MQMQEILISFALAALLIYFIYSIYTMDFEKVLPLIAGIVIVTIAYAFIKTDRR